MTNNFRREVEKILECSDMGVLVPCPYPEISNKYNSCTECQVDRICEAAKRMGVRMPVILKGTPTKYDDFQAHIKKETEG